MKKEKCVKAEINADGRQVSILSLGRNNDYISLTDIARYKSDDPNDVIKNWMRGKDVIQFLGLWEKLNNPDFKPVEFDGFKMEAGTNAFTLSPQNGLQQQMQSVLFQRQVVMEGLLPILILLLNLHPGFQPNLSCILLKIISG